MNDLNRKPRTGFTLIELLVVIAIIAILAAMLLPALQSAKNRSQMSLCSSNIKEIGRMSELYSTDNDSFIVPLFCRSDSNPWIHVFYKNNYFRDRALSRCPARESWLYYSQMIKGDWMAETAPYSRWSHYGINSAISLNPNTKKIYKAGNVVNPSKKVLFAETKCEGTSLRGYYSFGVGTSTGRMHNAHRKQSNIVFADGHLEVVENAFDNMQSYKVDDKYPYINPEYKAK